MFWLSPIIIGMLLFIAQRVFRGDEIRAEQFNSTRLAWVKMDLIALKEKMNEKSIENNLSLVQGFQQSDEVAVFFEPDSLPTEIRSQLSTSDLPIIEKEKITVIVKLLNKYNQSITYWRIDTDGKVVKLSIK